LIVTLWVLSFLTILVVNLGFMVRTQLQFADHLQDRLKMYYIARGGIEKAAAELYEDQTDNVDTLNESWANNEELFRDFPFIGGYITVSYKPGGLPEEEEAGLYGAMDESSRIDINNAPADVLKTLLENAGEVETDEAIDIANSIVDWRDKDVALSEGGAENDYYQGLSDRYECKNGNFQIAEELLLVKGMTPEIFARIKDLVTVYGTQQVNINTAGFSCLRSLGLESDLCEKIITFRRGSDERDGTEDDYVLKNPSEIMNVGSLFTKEATQINSLISRNIFKVRSDTFRIISRGILKNARGDRSREIVCVLKRQKDKSPQLLYWHEN